ncbi:MAG: hypothetical protein OXH79_09695 [Boseongicola sp.]|nr:hypothetical protein [Boseongicola sp.]
MTDRHEAGMEARPAALGDSNADQAVAATKEFVASAREIGRTLASVAEAEHPDMNIDGVFGLQNQVGTPSAEARSFARASAQGRGRK